MSNLWGETLDDQARVSLGTLIAGERNPTSSSNAYQSIKEDWNWTIVSGVTGDQAVSSGVPAIVKAVRVGAGAALAGAVQVKDGGTVKDTFNLGLAAGTERDYKGARIETALIVNMANVADVVHVFWRPL